MKNWNNIFPNRGSNPVRWTQSPTLYHIAIKAGLYRKVVQVYHIPIPGDILPLRIDIRPWISRSPRITWNETQGVSCTHVGYLRWAPNITGEKMEITFFHNRELNPVRWTLSPTLYHVAIKAGLYRKAVQVYHIPIPGDIMNWDKSCWMRCHVIFCILYTVFYMRTTHWVTRIITSYSKLVKDTL